MQQLSNKRRRPSNKQRRPSTETNGEQILDDSNCKAVHHHSQVGAGLPSNNYYKGKTSSEDTTQKSLEVAQGAGPQPAIDIAAVYLQSMVKNAEGGLRMGDFLQTKQYLMAAAAAAAKGNLEDWLIHNPPVDGERDRLRMRVKDLEQSIKEMEAKHEKEHQDLVKQVDQRILLVTSEESRLATAKSEFASFMEAQQEAMEKEKVKWQEELSYAKEKAHKDRAQLELAAQERDAQLQKSKSQLEQANKAWRESAEKEGAAQIQALQADANGFKDRIAQLEAELNSALQTAKSSAGFNSFISEIKVLESSLQMQKQRVQQLQDENKRVDGEKIHILQDCKSLEDKAQDLARQIEQMRILLDAAVATLSSETQARIESETEQRRLRLCNEKFVNEHLHLQQYRRATLMTPEELTRELDRLRAAERHCQQYAVLIGSVESARMWKHRYDEVVTDAKQLQGQVDNWSEKAMTYCDENISLAHRVQKLEALVAVEKNTDKQQSSP